MSSSRSRIVIVEDELIVAHSIQMRLELYGYEVAGIAKSGEDALEMLESASPELILMDIRLAGILDGISTAEEIRKNRDVPIIFLTAYSDDDTLARAKIAEPFGYIIKPFETRELVNNIEIALYRKKMADQLSASEARFRGLFENAVIGLILVDASGTVVEVNRRMVDLLDCSREEALASDGPLARIVRKHAGANGTEPSEPGARSEVEIETSAGVPRLFQVTSAEIPKGTNAEPFVAHFVEDVTELRRYERDLEDRQRALRMLFLNEESIREEERTRLSRDIHDVLGQMLTALKMDLHWLNSHSKPEPQGSVSEMIGQVDDMIKFVKKLCSELRDNVLDVFGFDVSLDEHLNQFMQRTGVEVSYENECGDITLARDKEIALLRIIQEALTNVARHADATRVVVRAACHDGTVQWDIRDDGCGFDADEQDPGESLGLLGMKERATSWNGSVRVTSKSGEGTIVTVLVPLEDKVPS
ncbi:MAG: response regulator [Spirochaetales bacterium]